MLETGDNLLVVHRRLFERDHSRFFVGRVEAYQDGVVRIRGYSFARDTTDGNVCRKEQCHTKLYAIGSGTLITYLISSDVNIDHVKMEPCDEGLCLTDGQNFSMNISEWIHHT